MITEQDRIAAEAAASEITHVAREARAADGEQDDLESSRIRHHENLSALTLKALGVALQPLTEEERLRLALISVAGLVAEGATQLAQAEIEHALAQNPAPRLTGHLGASATVAALTQRNEDLQATLMQALNAIELGAPALARETLQKALRGEVAKTASEQGPVPF